MMESPRALGRLVGVVPVVGFEIEGLVEDADDADDAGDEVSWRLC